MVDEILPGTWEQGSGDPVVLLHCAMGSKDQWRPLGRLLKDEYRVIAFDLYGYGETPFPVAPSPFRLEDEAALIERGLDKLIDRRQPFHLVGHSYGGAVALHFAQTRRKRIRTLALFEPVAFHLLPPGDPALRPVLEMDEALAKDIGRGDLAAAAARFIDYWGAPGAFAASKGKTRESLVASIPKILLDFQALFGAPHTLDDCRSLDIPVALLAGRDSRPPALRVAELLAASLPDCRRYWVAGGHMAPVTRSAEVNALIKAYLLAHRWEGGAPGP